MNQASVGADLSCPPPHPVCTLPGRQVITGNNRPVPVVECPHEYGNVHDCAHRFIGPSHSLLLNYTIQHAIA
ncbi:MAG: hypothetical protein ACR2H5_21385 [Ktedonobacteraceae bacterium]